MVSAIFLPSMISAAGWDQRQAAVCPGSAMLEAFAVHRAHMEQTQSHRQSLVWIGSARRELP